MNQFFKCFWLCLICSVCVATNLNAQFSALFRPGMRLGATYQPPTSDSTGMSLTQLRSTFILPLNAKAELKPKELKANLSAHFLVLNGGFRQLDALPLGEAQTVSHFSAGVIGARASALSGVIAYGATIGVVSHKKHGLLPFGAGGAVKMFIKGVNKQNFVGIGVAYAAGRVLPVPIVGLRRKIFDKAHVTVLLPIQADLTYRLEKGSQLTLMAGWNGFASQMNMIRRFQLPLNFEPKTKMQLAQLKTTLTFNWRVNKSFRILLEGGATAWSSLTLSNERMEWKASSKPTAYIGGSVRINLGNSPISSQIFGTD